MAGNQHILALNVRKMIREFYQASPHFDVLVLASLVFIDIIFHQKGNGAEAWQRIRQVEELFIQDIPDEQQHKVSSDLHRVINPALKEALGKHGLSIVQTELEGIKHEVKAIS